MRLAGKILTLMTTTAAALAVAAGPAAAATPTGCDTEEFCVYMNSSYGGSRFESRGPFADWRSTQPYATLYDEDSSSYNKWITQSVSIYNNAYYGGGRTICTNRGTGVLGFNSQGDRGGSHQGVGAAC